MGTINKEWHLSPKMPSNPTEDQRLSWHLEHAKNCACREMPPALLALAKSRGIKVEAIAQSP